VYLVGAGPGDPGLVTRRALELIGAADAILYDRLVPPGALDGARPDAELRYVGKRPGEPSLSQDAINSALVQLAESGKTVVRLKGGDPFVFGRGGEEAQALAAAGVPYEVVPGVTAGVAAPAYAGIPVTHRDDASAVAFVTGHEDPAKAESALDWSALAAFPGTLVLYMGIRRLPEITAALVAAGRPPGQPAAVIARGTQPAQRTVTGTLADIADRAAAAEIEPPAVTVVGDVAALRDELAWFEARPLLGRRVVVTRARAQASGLAARLASLGADVLEAPVIRIEPREGPELRTALAAAGDYALICFTSANGARFFAGALKAAGRDARAIQGRVAAVGPATAAELEGSLGVMADVVSERSLAAGLVETLAHEPVEGRRVLVVRAAEGRDVLAAALRERGAEVDEVPVYATVPEDVPPEQRGALEQADYVTFTSGSTVRYFLAAAGAPRDGTRVVSIGPITSDAARAAGLDVHVEAERHDVDGLVEALLADATARAGA
jgi:uroporphyrinogen III methyltransferase/synthase